ncbi:MAG: nucleotide exchange factor GrpE [Marinilabiliaceae bacterium]|nr:nucleotide exchange factor GrpE [Marinilabiliaceae bacterium]
MKNISDLYSSFNDNENGEQSFTSAEVDVSSQEVVPSETENVDIDSIQPVVEQEKTFEATDKSEQIDCYQQVATVDEESIEEPNEEPPSANNVELSELKEMLSDLSKQFEQKLKYDKHKEGIIDKLHAENQEYKNDLLKKFLSPFIHKVILLIDDYTTLYKKHSETDISEINVPKLLKLFGSFSEDLEALLNDNGVEAFMVEGENIDFLKQKIVETVATDLAEKDKTVCRRIKKGFMMDGKIIRPEHISCYKYENQEINNK